MNAHEFETYGDPILEAYLSRWDNDVAKPLQEWQRMLSEAKLSPEQINTLFGDVATRTKDMKTTTGKVAGVAAKGAKLAAKALPSNVTAKIHDLIKDTKPVKDFDAAFERAKANLVNKLGGDDSKIVQYTTSLARLAKAHPIMGAAVIGVLTTAAAVATGGVGAGIVGALLKTGNELLKGESLSKSLASGAGAGTVGALAGWGVKEIAQWMPGMSFDMSKVPGYADLVHVKHLHQTNGITTFSLDTDMTSDAARKVNKLLDIARNSDYDKQYKIYRDIEQVFSDPEYLDTIKKVTGNNTDLYNKAVATAKKAADFWGGVADAAQGGATAAAKPNEKISTAESINLSEADIKGIAGSIANWAKTQASQVTQQITPEKLGKAWRDAGSPDDSNALHGILLKAGVPADVLAAAYGAQKIPVPRGQSMTKDAIRKRDARAKAKAAADNLPVNTGDPAEDAKVKQIYAQQGKAAAITYLQTLLTNAQEAEKANAANAPAAVQGMKLQASNGKTYELSIGKAGDRIWLDSDTRSEAPENIDAELSQKIESPQAPKPVAIKSHVDPSYTQAAAKPVR